MSESLWLICLSMRRHTVFKNLGSKGILSYTIIISQPSISYAMILIGLLYFLAIKNIILSGFQLIDISIEKQVIWIKAKDHVMGYGELWQIRVQDLKSLRQESQSELKKRPTNHQWIKLQEARLRMIKKKWQELRWLITKSYTKLGQELIFSSKVKELQWEIEK